MGSIQIEVVGGILPVEGKIVRDKWNGDEVLGSQRRHTFIHNKVFVEEYGWYVVHVVNIQ